MKYKVEITETLQRMVEISAYSEEDALAKVREQYRSEEIVLSSSDFIDYTIEVAH